MCTLITKLDKRRSLSATCWPNTSPGSFTFGKLIHLRCSCSSLSSVCFPGNGNKSVNWAICLPAGLASTLPMTVLSFPGQLVSHKPDHTADVLHCCPDSPMVTMKTVISWPYHLFHYLGLTCRWSWTNNCYADISASFEPVASGDKHWHTLFSKHTYSLKIGQDWRDKTYR